MGKSAKCGLIDAKINIVCQSNFANVQLSKLYVTS